MSDPKGDPRQQTKQEIREMENLLASVGRELDDLRSKAQKASGEAQQRIERRITEFDQSYREMQDRLTELRRSSGEALGRLSSGLRSAYQTLKKSVEDAASQF